MKRAIPALTELTSLLEIVINEYPPPEHYREAVKKLQAAIPFRINENYFRHYVYNEEHKPTKDRAEELLLHLSERVEGLAKERGRWLKETNRILLAAESILSSPDEVIEEYKTELDYRELYDVLTEAYYIRSRGNSIDNFISQYNYPKNILDLITHCLKTLLQVEIIFRSELYGSSKYIAAAKKYLSKDSVYYQTIKDIPVKASGKQVTAKTIGEATELYRNYLRGLISSDEIGDFTGTRGKFFKEYKFYYLIDLMQKISSVLRLDMFQKEQRSLDLMRKELLSFRPQIQANILKELSKGLDLPRIKSKRGKTNKKLPYSIEKELANIKSKFIAIFRLTLPTIMVKGQATQLSPKPKR
jgi:hypothetical protein